MQIFGNNGNIFKLSILGYQFPEMKSEAYDSNWLIIEVDVTCSQGAWIAQNPCLLTYEVARLANWFEAIASETNTKSIQKFIEPNLEFHFIDSPPEKCLRIYFELELRPEWAAWEQGIMKDLWVDFPLSDLDLNQIANSLRSQLCKYPQRAIK